MPDLSRKTILLVDDDPILALTNARKLEKFGYTVLTAYTGEQAIASAAAYSEIDLALIDIDLGRGIDGTQAAMEILRWRNLPVVFFTSHTDQEIVEKVRGIPHYGYAIKAAGDFVLQSTIEMAFELFGAHRKTQEMEVTLRRVNERLEMAQHAARAGTWDWDILSGHLEWSAGMFEVFGLNPQRDKASFDTWNAALHPQDTDTANRRIEQALQDHKDLQNEYRVIWPNGQMRWIEALGQGVYDDQG